MSTNLPDGVAKLKTIISKEIKEIYDDLAHICPRLILHPAIQIECFDLWTDVVNRINETKNSVSKSELRGIEDNLDSYKDDIEAIKRDLGITLPLPELTCKGDINFEERCKETNQTMEELYEKANNLCPDLIEYPTVQKSCFEQWKKIANEEVEIRKAKTIKTIELIGDALDKIEKTLKKIEQDKEIY